MLTHIHIRNFTIVQSLSLDFKTGLNVLTGETGAGKSIWVDAIELAALGKRADTSVIRQGQTQCDITVCFDLSHIASATKWLNEHQLEAEGECIVRRTIQRQGTSRSTINGRPCTLHLVRELGQLILNIHSQHQQQKLLKPEAQRQSVDHFAKHEKTLNDIQTIYSQWQQTHSQIELLKHKAQNRDSELSLFRYQLTELETAAIEPNEWQELSKQHQQLHNAKHLMAQLNQALNLTLEDEQHSATHLLSQAIAELNDIQLDDPQLHSIKALLNTAAIHLQEAGNELGQYRDHLELRPQNLATIENRLTVIHDLARKHHVAPEALPDIQKSLIQKIKQLENIDSRIEALHEDQRQLLNRYEEIAKKITHNRKIAAQQLSRLITQSTQKLGMENARFSVQLDPIDATMSAYGNERVTFLISTNPGQDLKPLNKIISGGELSRISLALQVAIVREKDRITLIFDEVDLGIGGKTAEIVGQLLRSLGEYHQLLCITHLPQVAAKGHHHYKVIKTTTRQSTNTEIVELNQQQRVDELARMLSGAKITSQTLSHASEMLCS